MRGGLLSGSLDVPRFSRIARSYLLHIGHLDWTKINPDIFGLMIQLKKLMAILAHGDVMITLANRDGITISKLIRQNRSDRRPE